MLDYNLSIEDFKKMLMKPEYKAKLYESEYYYEFEQLNSYGKGLISLFDDLAKKIGRVPTQTEYVNEGCRLAREFFNDPKKINGRGERVLSIGRDEYGHNEFYAFVWDEHLKENVRNRLGRSYMSYLAEYSTILTIKSLFPDYYVGTNSYLDFVAGVDIVVGNRKMDKMLYIHITSDSSYSKKMLKEKGKRVGVAKNRFGNMRLYKRNFNKGHLHLAFTYNESASTLIVNGNPVIRDEHIRNVIELSFNTPHLDSFRKPEQLIRLDNWIKKNYVNKKGLGNIWI